MEIHKQRFKESYKDSTRGQETLGQEAHYNEQNQVCEVLLAEVL